MRAFRSLPWRTVSKLCAHTLLKPFWPNFTVIRDANRLYQWKTLPIASTILLDDPARELVTITFSPLKRLAYFYNSLYGIPTSTVVINQGTPDGDKWYQVRSSLKIQILLKLRAASIQLVKISLASKNFSSEAWGQVADLCSLLFWMNLYSRHFRSFRYFHPFGGKKVDSRWFSTVVING